MVAVFVLASDVAALGRCEVVVEVDVVNGGSAAEVHVLGTRRCACVRAVSLLTVTMFTFALAGDVAVVVSGQSSWARTLLVFAYVTLLVLCDGVAGRRFAGCRNSHEGAVDRKVS